MRENPEEIQKLRVPMFRLIEREVDVMLNPHPFPEPLDVFFGY